MSARPMKYHGNNPVALALVADDTREVRAALLRTLRDYQAAAERSNASASLPAAYQRNQAAAECAALCAQVVMAFHAVHHGATPEQGG
jgi:hypothetical protein